MEMENIKFEAQMENLTTSSCFNSKNTLKPFKLDIIISKNKIIPSRHKIFFVLCNSKGFCRALITKDYLPKIVTNFQKLRIERGQW